MSPSSDLAQILVERLAADAELAGEAGFQLSGLRAAVQLGCPLRR